MRNDTGPTNDTIPCAREHVRTPMHVYEVSHRRFPEFQTALATWTAVDPESAPYMCMGWPAPETAAAATLYMRLLVLTLQVVKKHTHAVQERFMSCSQPLVTLPVEITAS
jgi:hypothetical protein